MAARDDLPAAAQAAPGYGSMAGPMVPPLLLAGRPLTPPPMASPVQTLECGGRRAPPLTPPPMQRQTTHSFNSDSQFLSSRLEDPDQHEFEQVEESAYSGAMATIIIDAQRLYLGSKYPNERIIRIGSAILMCAALVGMQLYVLMTIKTFVTSPAVRSIRQVYSEYQTIMYNGHVRDSGWGFKLGIGGPDGKYFDPNQFSKVPDDLKGSVCLIPFSQPAYLSTILFIWSLSVIGELKACVMLVRWLSKIKNADLEHSILEHTTDEGEKLHIIKGMPFAMKVILFLGIILPRFLATLLVFWLGCRWLASTLDFTEVLINAIALEFVIQLNGLLYSTFVSKRTAREVKNIRLDVKQVTVSKGDAPSIPTFVGAFVWAILACAWIYLYLKYLQLVLPGYQWDVRGPCSPWVAKRFDFWRI